MMFKTISIIIPAFNEEQFIETVIGRVVTADTLNLKKEIIVIDDGSTDKTVSKVEKFIKSVKLKRNNLKIILIQKKRNEGKGKAIREGFLKSTGDIVIVQDADLEYSPNDYPLLLSPIAEGQADVVYGSRFITEKAHRVLYFWHFVGNSLMTLISNMITNLNFTDIYCGYKVFRGELIRDIAKSLTSGSFEIEAEMTKKISKIENIRCYEVGVSYFGRTYMEGKKIRPWDAAAGVWKLIVS